MNINREKNYKINASRIRNYFMTPTAGPLKLPYENEAVGTCPITAIYDWVTIHTTSEDNKAYCWIYTDAITNRVCIEYYPQSSHQGTFSHDMKGKDGVERGYKMSVSAARAPYIVEQAPDIPKEITYGGLEGTILYGALNNNRTRFVIEDVFYYRGKHVTYATWAEKMHIYKDLFATFKLPNGQFKLPRTYSKPAFMRLTAHGAAGLPSNIVYVKFFKSHSKKACVIWYNRTGAKTEHISQKNVGRTLAAAATTPPPRSVYFWTKADIRDDIYHLYDTQNATPQGGVGLALIPDFKTSIKMNAIFRKIRENTRLDALEESDDEADFENVSDDKYLIQRDRCVKLKYAWHARWRKYYPIDL